MKNLLLKILVLCLCLSTALFVFTACVPENTNNCQHEWVVDKTAKNIKPTKTKDGKDFYVCGLCNQKKEQKVERLKYLDALDKSLDQSYGFLLTDFSYTFSLEYFNHDDSVNQSDTEKLTIDFAEFYLEVDEDGEYSGYGYGTGKEEIKWSNSMPEEINRDIEFVAVVEDGIVYVRTKHREIPGAYDYIQAPVDLMLQNLGLHYLELPKEIFSDSSNLLNNFLIPIGDGIYEDQERNIDTFIKKGLEILFSKEKVQGNTKYTLNAPALKIVNSNLYSAKISAVYDGLFGKGKFNELKENSVSAMDITFGEMVDYIISNGGIIWEAPEGTESENTALTLADLFEELDFVAKGLAEQMGLNSEEITIETFEDLLYCLTGYNEGDIYEIVSSEEFKNMTIGEFILMNIAAEEDSSEDSQGYSEEETQIKAPETVEELKIMLANYIDEFGNMNFYESAFENETERKDMKQDVDEFLDLIKDSFKLEFTVDKNGIIQGAIVDFGFEYSDKSYDDWGEHAYRIEKTSVKANAQIIKDYQTEKTDLYNQVVAETKEKVGLVQLNEENMIEAEVFTFTFDDDGNLSHVELNYEEEYSRIIGEASIKLTDQIIAISSTCSGVLNVIIYDMDGFFLSDCNDAEWCNEDCVEYSHTCQNYGEITFYYDLIEDKVVGVSMKWHDYDYLRGEYMNHYDYDDISGVCDRCGAIGYWK